jgi:predicted PurR-regulated permease PerM
VPRIYERTLHVSPFSVLIAVLIGGELLGVIGVFRALPLAAAIPIIVRIWREGVDTDAKPALQLPLSPTLSQPSTTEDRPNEPA